MLPSSSLLTLPLEVRQHIYSYLLINKYPELFLWSYRNYSAYCLSLTCRQFYLEVLNYYYAKNVFRLSLIDYECLPTQLPAWSKRRAEYLEINLKRVQHLQLEMELYDDGLSDPLQEEQPKWFRAALMRARQGSVEKCWLKSLDIQVCGPRSWNEYCDYAAQQGTDEEMARYNAFFQPLRGRIGKLTIFGREVMLDDEDVGVDSDTKINDFNGISRGHYF